MAWVAVERLRGDLEETSQPEKKDWLRGSRHLRFVNLVL